jgi:hypothetical protein
MVYRCQKDLAMRLNQTAGAKMALSTRLLYYLENKELALFFSQGYLAQ